MPTPSFLVALVAIKVIVMIHSTDRRGDGDAGGHDALVGYDISVVPGVTAGLRRLLSAARSLSTRLNDRFGLLFVLSRLLGG
ncbi:hypothetical protein F5141DRAFT_1145392 [Pisolithus sp. B1]|nr:hypothetical protein F5141DRAFT_1145392 [Pisolithus sp. B1]